MNLLNRFDLFLVRKMHKFCIFYETKYRVEMRDSLIFLLIVLVMYYFEKVNSISVDVYHMTKAEFREYIFNFILNFLTISFFIHKLGLIFWADTLTLRISQIRANSIRVFLYKIILISLGVYFWANFYFQTFHDPAYKISKAEMLLVGLPWVLSDIVLSRTIDILFMILIYLLISIITIKKKR